MAYNENLKNLKDKGMLPLFDAGYINIARQYLTIGVNGLVEGAEFLGIPIKDCKEYQDYIGDIPRHDRSIEQEVPQQGCDVQL